MFGNPKKSILQNFFHKKKKRFTIFAVLVTSPSNHELLVGHFAGLQSIVSLSVMKAVKEMQAMISMTSISRIY